MRLVLSGILFGFSVITTANGFADEIASWNFKDGKSHWNAMHQVELSVVDNALQIRSTGNDPHLSTDVSGPAGSYRLTLRAQFSGQASVQVFWTTEADPGTSEGHSVRSDFRADDDGGFAKLQLWFRTDSPLTSLRLDPLSREGTMLVDSIVLTDDEPPAPQATAVSDIRVTEGFQVELLYSVSADDYGSWVSMTPDPKGRLIVSDQYGKLYRLTPPGILNADELQIETINVDIGMAQGLLYAFDSLYVMVNGTDADKQGLYRVTDADHDDQFDTVEWLRKIDGGGEHGPHAVILAPDGQSLYVCAGNHTATTEFQSSRVPQNWAEDHLLPRMWDAGGHAVGKQAPGGWIANVSPDGQHWELIASGFRNEYDIAFNAHGELFTYDADMEWDVGTPWYRPTRVNHVTSGAEFGWRSGTGKWPEYYPDSLPSVVDIGPGSPTGIVFGNGARFPAKYQNALFISDWSYGVVYAVHMTPSGASYSGKAEPFISAAPLPVTDIVINPIDQAMYFAIGGRRTQSGLYRVTYTGNESTETLVNASGVGTDLRTLRHKLEALHQDQSEYAVDTLWPYLGHPDRHIRFAARIALEHRPLSEWADRALTEAANADAKITALLALARNASRERQVSIIESLGRLNIVTLTEAQALDALRVLSLCFIRMGEPDPAVGWEVSAVLNRFYPSESPKMNRELAALLIYLQHPDAATKTLKLLSASNTQEDQLYYAMCLRAFTGEWTLEQRTEYFNWFVDGAGMRGGHSFSGFLKNIRDEAIQTLTDVEKAALQEVLDRRPEPAEPVIEASTRPFVNKWTVDELIADVAASDTTRDVANGRQAFRAAGCFKCHRFQGQGGIVGPDLTAVGRRFNDRTMLESLIEPSKVISDQYEATVFVTESGKQVTGRIVNLNNDTLMVSEDMLDPGRLTVLKRSAIEEMFTSKTSQMPAGLLDHLTRDEILDLIAYLRSGAIDSLTSAGE